MKLPDRIYERLTPEERGRAFIEAAANQDVEELERLNATCPIHSYWGEDETYTRFKYGSMIVTLMAHQQEQRVAEGIYLALVYSRSDDDAVAERAKSSAERLLARYLELQTAFELFCDSIGVNATSLREAHAAKPSVYLNAIGEAFGAEVQEPDRIAAQLTLLKSWWGAVT